MNYQNHYNLLTSEAKIKLRFKKDGYYEEHHIVPRSMGGSNQKKNKVLLTAKEHFVAHHLLWKIHKNAKMALAFKLMSVTKGYKISAREYATVKLKIISSKLGVIGFSKERRVLQGNFVRDNKLGIFSLSKEKMSTYAKINCKLDSCKLGRQKGTENSLKNGATRNNLQKAINASAANGASSKNLQKAKTVNPTGYLEGGAATAAKNKEKWENSLVNAGFEKYFKPCLVDSLKHGLKYFYGNVCRKHPKLEGKRILKGRRCPNCNKENKVNKLIRNAAIVPDRLKELLNTKKFFSV